MKKEELTQKDGAIAGATIGGAIGYIVGGVKGCMIGAGTGALAGAAMTEGEGKKVKKVICEKVKR